MSEIVGAYFAEDGLALAASVRQGTITAEMLLDAAVEPLGRARAAARQE